MAMIDAPKHTVSFSTCPSLPRKCKYSFSCIKNGPLMQTVNKSRSSFDVGPSCHISLVTLIITESLKFFGYKVVGSILIKSMVG